MAAGLFSSVLTRAVAGQLGLANLAGDQALCSGLAARGRGSFLTCQQWTEGLAMAWQQGGLATGGQKPGNGQSARSQGLRHGLAPRDQERGSGLVLTCRFKSTALCVHALTIDSQWNLRIIFYTHFSNILSQVASFAAAKVDARRQGLCSCKAEKGPTARQLPMRQGAKVLAAACRPSRA